MRLVICDGILLLTGAGGILLTIFICLSVSISLIVACCRYIPLSRNKGSLSSGSRTALGSSFPSLSFSDRILKAASTSLMMCKYGEVEAAAKVCSLKKC